MKNLIFWLVGLGFISVAAIALLLSPAVAVADAKVDGKQPEKDDKKDDKQSEKDEEKQAEQAAKDLLAEFSKTIKDAKSSAEYGAAVRTLGSVKHPLIVSKLVQLLNGPGDDALHTTVVDTLEAVGDPRCVPALSAVLLANLSKVNEHVQLCTRICKALGKFADRRGAPGLIEAIDSKDMGVAKAACEACGKVKDPSMIDELIKLYKAASVPDANVSVGGRSGGGNVANPKKSLKDPSRKALVDITGESHSTPAEWKKWWQANAATWRPPQAAQAGK